MGTAFNFQNQVKFPQSPLLLQKCIAAGRKHIVFGLDFITISPYVVEKSATFFEQFHLVKKLCPFVNNLSKGQTKNMGKPIDGGLNKYFK